MATPKDDRLSATGDVTTVVMVVGVSFPNDQSGDVGGVLLVDIGVVGVMVDKAEWADFSSVSRLLLCFGMSI